MLEQHKNVSTRICEASKDRKSEEEVAYLFLLLLWYLQDTVKKII